ncbi:MAG: DNA adenine methylase [Fimbriimonadales bacterium]
MGDIGYTSCVIKYLGSKRVLLPWIVQTLQQIDALVPVRTVCDLFSGSARVGHALKAQGYFVIANDLYTYAFVLAQALVEANRQAYPPEYVKPILEHLQNLPPEPDWFTRTYCEQAHYFQPPNGARIEAIRNAIETDYSDDPLLKAILLTSLMLAADKVDSTTGLQMAYLKRWAPRSYNELVLSYPPLLLGDGKAYQMDARTLASELEADLFYLDPPYNQHSYIGNYHVWETLVRWDQPSTYGVAQKRWDVRERTSDFNSKRRAKQAFTNLVHSIRAQHLMVSFNDEGFFRCDEVETILKEWGYVVRQVRPYKRYIGAQIGIYNPQGQRVGTVSHTTNHELLFIATKSRAVYTHFASVSP